MITANKQRANELYQFMKSENRTLTKEEMCRFFGWKYNSNSDRQVRGIIALIAQKRPVIATSDKVGLVMLVFSFFFRYIPK